MLRRTSLLLVLVGALACSLAAPALAGTEDDEAIAEGAVLTEDDVADYGLVEDTAADDSLPSGAVCKKVRAAIKAADRAPHAVTAFTDDAGTNVEDRVVIYKSVKAARVPLLAYASNRGAQCLESELEKDLNENLDSGSNATFSGESANIPLGDEAFVYTIPVTITDADGNVNEIVIEFGLIRVGTGLAVLQTVAPDEAFFGSEELATILTDRLTESV